MREHLSYGCCTNQLYEYTAAVRDWLRMSSKKNSVPINLFKPQNKPAGTKNIHYEYAAHAEVTRWVQSLSDNTK